MDKMFALRKIKALAEVEWEKVNYPPKPDNALFTRKEFHFCATEPAEVKEDGKS